MNDSARRELPPTLAREAARKSIHLTSSAIPVSLALGAPHRLVEGVLFVCVAGALAVEVARRHSSRVEQSFTQLFAPLLRAREHAHVTGATWLLGAMLAAVLLLPRDIAIAATWAVAVGDASAAIVGMYFGRPRAQPSRKSLEGSTACMVVSMCGALLLARMPLAESILLGVVASIAERLPWPGDDNARIIVAVGATAWVWRAVSY